jgi:hypothetical protein
MIVFLSSISSPAKGTSSNLTEILGSGCADYPSEGVSITKEY